jgi:protein ImuB
VVLIGHDVRRGKFVVACSVRAQRQGVRIGMPLAEASALLGTSGLFAYDPLADRDALARLAVACEAYSPLVFLEDEGSESIGGPSCLWLDVQGVASRFGGERALAQKILLQFRQQRYAGRVGIADTFGAAWALAHFDPLSRELVAPGIAGVDDTRPHARRHPRQAAPRHLRGKSPPPATEPHRPSIAPTNPGEPSGSPPSTAATTTARPRQQSQVERIQIAAPGNSAAALARLPVEALRLHHDTVRLLHDLGVIRIDQLMALPRSGLAARLGDEVLRRLDQVRGQSDELLQAHHPSQEMIAHWQAEHATSKRDAIQCVVQHLCQHLADLLAHRQQGALQIDAWLRWQTAVVMDTDSSELSELPRSNSQSADFPPTDSPSPSVRIRVGTFRPTANGAHLWELFQLQLESLVVPGPVSEIKLVAVTTSPLEAQQQMLWSDHGGAQRIRQLAHLIDRLSNRLGPSAVGQPRLRTGNLPEHAYELKPLTGSAAMGKRVQHTANSLCPPSAAGQRPLQLWPRPQAVTVTCNAEGHPCQFIDSERTHRLIACWGPERLETHWWRGPSVRRDYYQVESERGERYWLFQELVKRHWYVHGTFF